MIDVVNWKELASELAWPAYLLMLNVLAVDWYLDAGLGAWVILNGVLVLMVDLVAMWAFIAHKLRERKCEREGHPSWMYIGGERNDPTPVERRCHRCGHQEPIED